MPNHGDASLWHPTPVSLCACLSDPTQAFLGTVWLPSNTSAMLLHSKRVAAGHSFERANAVLNGLGQGCGDNCMDVVSW